MADSAAAKDMALGDAEKVAGKYLTFSLQGEEFGLQILRVREIIGMVDITPVPNTPPYIRGVINLRGKVIAVVCLRLKFGLPFQEPDERTCIIVVEAKRQDDTILMGVVVDRVNEVSDVKAGAIEPPPSFGISVDTSYLVGMAKVSEKVKMLLDIDRVLVSQ
jgi:purine-binding chemotaxis protein CheW